MCNDIIDNIDLLTKISRSPRFLGQLTHAQTVYTRPSFSIESGLESRLVALLISVVLWEAAELQYERREEDEIVDKLNWPSRVDSDYTVHVNFVAHFVITVYTRVPAGAC